MSIAREEIKSKTKSWKTQGQEDRKKKTTKATREARRKKYIRMMS